MSDESISNKEDTENLLYIARKLQIGDDSYGEGHPYMRESVNSEGSVSTSVENLTASQVELLDTLDHSLGPQIFNDSRVMAKTQPFEIIWSFGMNWKVNIVNLTKEGRNEVFYSSSNVPIIYNYCNQTLVHLGCHHNSITYISADDQGRWLVTAAAKEGFVHIWDWERKIENEKQTPVWSMFAVYGNRGVNMAKISPSARYLITIGPIKEDTYSVDMWLWTLGNDIPEDSYKVSNVHGSPVQICFNPNIEEHIMVVFSKQIFLLQWDIEKQKFSFIVTPTLMHKNKIGYLTGGTYADSCHECYTSSNKGCITIFRNTLYAKRFEEGELDNSKIFIGSSKVSMVALECCTTVDGLIVTGNARGEIYFFNKRVEILYWLRDFNLGAIVSISFNLNPKLKIQDLNKYFITPSKEDGGIFNCDFNDMAEELELLFEQELPTDASTKREPFIVRDFFVATSQSNIYAIDVVKHTCTPIFHTAGGYVTAIEVHEESNHIVIGYSTNRILLMEYEKNIVISECILPKYEEEINSVISCIKYSVKSYHLVCGKTNGEVWILEPILLTPRVVEPFQVTKNKVVKIKFSENPIQFAYYDDKSTVCLFSYSTENSKWKFRGKIRAHYQEITDIMFLPKAPSKLCTIAKDRHLVQYNNNDVDTEDFNIESTNRIEQTAVPMCFMYWTSESNSKHTGYIIIADNKHKLKFLYPDTKVPKSLVLAPAFGCFKNQLIRKMSILPNTHSRYMIFCTDRHFGIQILPPDGNPYKYIGHLGHPEKIQDFAASNDGKYVFTFGVNDHCVFKWSVNINAVETMKHLGGKELEPFYCLIEGGYHGWLFHEIKDLFYYMQILQQENIDLPRRVTDSILITEIPDLFRTIGYYPSDFELENMIIDVKYRNMDETNKMNEDINFIDFVKLYCNYKPVYGYANDDIEAAFNLLVKYLNPYYAKAHSISKNDLIDLLTSGGEPFTTGSLLKCFKTLMRVDTFEEGFAFLPDDINFQTFFEDILGIDMHREGIMDIESSDEEEVAITKNATITVPLNE
ncbi:cilia- and flagella-associated protein 251-like [Diabrotica virgifera virgifera]|uniref:Cilia- and flagella-associated protein 251 n=2 Tax=Diabrotica virgifera virgifera TaxID=50390 RepID=A0ABM5JVV4_DIAVI|nr:cilia- and flagella-associated protein 251-like [Diabrotica virgifera virgifera]